MKHTKTRAVIYCRTACVEQDKSSLNKQEKTLLNYAKKNNLKPEKVYKIQGSGRDEKLVDKLLKFVTRYRIHVIVCESCDTLTRTMAGANKIYAWLEKTHKNKIHLVKNKIVIHK